LSRIRDLVTILIKRWAPIFIATFVGLFVLIGYLFPTSLPVPYRGRQVELQDVLVEWAVIIAAFVLILGVINISLFHLRRTFGRQQGMLNRFYSLVMILAMVVGSIPPILRIIEILQREREIPMQETLDRIVFHHVISPLGASLAALLAFTLALAAFRLLRVRRGWGDMFLGWLFILVAVAVLLGSTPLTGFAVNLSPLTRLREWIINVPGMAGMRGLLLGVALGTVISALRIVASDRPHSEF
jgi:hypothetical protein